MEKMTLITKEKLNDLFKQEEASGQEYLDREKQIEIDGLLYSAYRDKRTNELYAVWEIRTVHMGFNSNEEGKVDELVVIVEREGSCKVSWGVTGRTMHEILAHGLKAELPQYDFDIGHNYHCLVSKRAG